MTEFNSVMEAIKALEVTIKPQPMLKTIGNFIGTDQFVYSTITADLSRNSGFKIDDPGDVIIL